MCPVPFSRSVVSDSPQPHGQQHPEKTTVLKDTCTLVFAAALFTIARTWNQPRCPLTDEEIKKLWCIYTMEYYSAIKNQIWVSSSEVDEPLACYIEWSRSENKEQILYINTRMWNLKNSNNLCGAAVKMQTQRTDLWIQWSLERSGRIECPIETYLPCVELASAYLP